MARVAVASLAQPPRIIGILDCEAPDGPRIGETDYEALLAGGDPDFVGVWPEDEWRFCRINCERTRFSRWTLHHPYAGRICPASA